MAHLFSLPVCATACVLVSLTYAGHQRRAQGSNLGSALRDKLSRQQQGSEPPGALRYAQSCRRIRVKTLFTALAELLLTYNPVIFKMHGGTRAHSSLQSTARCKTLSMQVLEDANGTLASATLMSWPDVTVNTLQSDLPDILAREPNWGLFAKNFKLIDQTGVTLKGLDPNRALLKVLTELHNKMTKAPFMDNFNVTTGRKLLASRDGTLKCILTAQWGFTIGSDLNVSVLQAVKNLHFPFLPYVQVLELEHQILPTSDAFPLRVATNSTIGFNPEGKVTSMEIHSWTINENELEPPETPSFRQLSVLEKWLCKNIVQPRALMEEQPSFLGQGSSLKRFSLQGQKAPNVSDAFPTVDTSPVEVLHAQLTALASGNVSQIFQLFSRARRQVIEEKARNSPRQIRVEPERVRMALKEMLTSHCPGLLSHRSSKIVESRGDPEPSNGLLPSWRYRVHVDGMRFFAFTLTLAPRGQYAFDGGHPEATRSDYGDYDPWSEYPGTPDALERCWLVWDITLEDGGGDSRIDIPASPARQPVLAR